ncbi:Dixin, partial [Ophiophagus hannah]
TWSHAFPELDHRYVVAHVEENGGRLPVEWSPKCPAPSLETSWEEHLLEQQDHLEKEMEEAKRMISGLQDALQQRLAQQDTVMLQIKQELLRANMDKEELHSQNKELSQKDRLLHQHQAKMEEMLHQLSEAGYQQVILYGSHNSQSNGFLQSLGKGTASSTHRGVCSPWSPRLGEGEGLSPGLPCGGRALAWWHLPPPASGSLSRQTSDLQLVREALRSLRNSFSGHDPQHHTIDSLEQGISSLMERLYRMEVQKRQEKRVRSHRFDVVWPSHPLRNP